MRPHVDSAILDLWERGHGLDRWRRDDALLGSRADAPRRLGARNLALLALRNELFDTAWTLRSACPHCRTEVEFAVESGALADSLGGASEADRNVEWRGRTIAARPATVDDLRAAAVAGTPDDVVRALLARCLDGIDAADCAPAELRQLGDRLEMLDPAASVEFALACPECGDTWCAPLDIADCVWGEVRHSAELLLLEVDALARAYGWSEPEIMALSPTRRAAYLQLAEVP
jgi:hypothetical protein